MAIFYPTSSSSGGSSSSELTATVVNVEKGKTYVGRDTSDETGVGSLRNATTDTKIKYDMTNTTPVIPSSNVYSATNTDGVTRVMVRMDDARGVVEQGTVIGVPQTILASSLNVSPIKIMSKQNILGVDGIATSDATATDDKVLSGYVYYRNGERGIGNLTIQSVTSFSFAQYSNKRILGVWARPTKYPWSGISIVAKQGGFPTNVNDGIIIYQGSGVSCFADLPVGTWYIRGWNYISSQYGWHWGSYVETIVNNNEIKGRHVFTENGEIRVPPNVYSIDLFVVGAGGRGGTTYSYYFGAGGGGGSYPKTIIKLFVNPNDLITASVAPETLMQASGANSTVLINGSAVLISAGGSKGNNSNGGSGGSGGGYGGYYSSEGMKDCRSAGKGGSDGSNGYAGLYGRHDTTGGGNTDTSRVGTGQGKTTKEFNESWNTLYSGGGGAGASVYDDWSATGGDGGGGNGARKSSFPPTKGAPNSGSGGGGGNNTYGGGIGGSGIVIVRWGY